MNNTKNKRKTPKEFFKSLEESTGFVYHLMKTNMISKFLFLFACFAALFLLTSSGKYYSDFKRAKKGVDTLVLLTPHVYIEFSKNQKFSKDDELSEILTQQIFNNSYSLLDKKYKLAGLISPLDSIDASELSNLFSMLDNSNKNTELSTLLFIQNRMKEYTNRYLLMVVFNGYYNADFAPYYRMNQMMGSNNSIRITIYPNTKFFESDMRILVFDNQKNIIVYYSKKYSKDIDPRIMNSVEKMTLDILRPLYYK
jgi:hypothetical protein